MDDRHPGPLVPHRARPPAEGGRLPRESLAEHLADALRERILSGELPGGSVLRQEAVAREYDVSRIPVREALRILESDGLVTVRLHRRAVVSAHSPDQIGELFDLRAMLERDLVERAAPEATPADVAHAEEVLRKLQIAYGDGDVGGWGSLNSEFHRSLCLPARREQTLALAANLHLVTERYIRLYHRLIDETVARAQSDHAEILRLYRAGKARQAGALVERHVQFTKRTLLQALERRRREGDAAPRRRR